MDITFEKMLYWGFGIFLILVGLDSLTQSFLAGIILFDTGLFLIPKVRQEIDKQFNVQFSGWVVIIIALVGVGVGTAMLPLADTGDITETGTQSPTDKDSQETVQSSSDADSQNETQEAVDTESQEDTQEVYQTNESVPVGDLAFNAQVLGTTDIIGNQYTSSEAAGTFVILSVTVRNNGDSQVIISSSNFAIKDAQDRTFEVSTDASTQLTMQDVDTFTFTELNPGLQTSGAIAFDIPQNAEGLELEVSEGFFGSTKYIELGNVSEFEPI